MLWMEVFKYLKAFKKHSFGTPGLSPYMVMHQNRRFLMDFNGLGGSFDGF